MPASTALRVGDFDGHSKERRILLIFHATVREDTGKAPGSSRASRVILSIDLAGLMIDLRSSVIDEETCQCFRSGSVRTGAIASPRWFRLRLNNVK